MVVGNIRPANRRHGVHNSQFDPLFKPWWKLFKNTYFISQRCDEMINIKNVLKLTEFQESEELELRYVNSNM